MVKNMIGRKYVVLSGGVESNGKPVIYESYNTKGNAMKNAQNFANMLGYPVNVAAIAHVGKGKYADLIMNKHIVAPNRKDWKEDMIYDLKNIKGMKEVLKLKRVM
jgi:hypothetical protein